MIGHYAPPAVSAFKPLLMCLGVVALIACSAPPKQPDDYEVSSASLPDVSRQATPSVTRNDSVSRESLLLASLEQGNHHPAIAALFHQAEQARQKRQWRKALKYLDQARQIQPRNAAVLYRQAWVNLRLGQASQAEQLLLRAKVFSTQDQNLTRRLNWLLADALDAQGKGQKAREARARATR
ncbi:MAG: hypothetical protein MK185_15695 [Saccharospirillaceae bacterium]|nr:hypothetical protein [Saccharospirillaceae bacterium]